MAEDEDELKRIREVTGIHTRSRSSTASTASGYTLSSCAKGEDVESDRELLSSPTAESSVDWLEESDASTAKDGAKLGLGALVLCIVVCGCACQAPYEVMNSRDKGCGPLISITEHVFGMLASLGALRQRRRLPWRLHFSLAAVSVSYTLFLNKALSSELPTLVLITMKNGNLVANMLLGMCFMRSRYSLGQYFAVLCISAGLVVTSVSGGQAAAGAGSPAASWSAAVGLVCLIGALLSRAATGLVQEVMCKTYDAPVQELLFYRCLLGLPLVLAQWGTIAQHAARWNGAEVSGFVWPTLWVLLVGNIAFDYATKVLVSNLIDRTSALTATLVLTFQRFVSFIVSTSLLSESHVGRDLWVGAVAVLLGTALYAAAPAALPQPVAKCKAD